MWHGCARAHHATEDAGEDAAAALAVAEEAVGEEALAVRDVVVVGDGVEGVVVVGVFFVVDKDVGEVHFLVFIHVPCLKTLSPPRTCIHPARHPNKKPSHITPRPKSNDSLCPNRQ